MKKCLLTYLIILFTHFCFSQNFTGQWKGVFIDKSAGISWGSNKCEYVIDLNVNGPLATGYSYTYFTEEGKRYYTICKISGKVDIAKKTVEVIETERTKTNIPIDVVNSFQKHTLRWRRAAGKEILEGNWSPAPGQNNGNTGFGTTLLSKRQLTEIAPYAKMSSSIKSNFFNTKKKNNTTSADLKSYSASLVKKPTVPIKLTEKYVEKKEAKSLSKQKAKLSYTTIKNDSTPSLNIITSTIKTTVEKAIPIGYEKRNNAVLHKVNVENKKIRIELYDNGDIDGDSISLFYNGKVLLAHYKLTSKPIIIEVEPTEDVNELVMYADNLGTIPPNTALMIVMDGNRRYEVRVTSDLKQSGTIQFLQKNKKE
jgi:hypothetical protein